MDRIRACYQSMFPPKERDLANMLGVIGWDVKDAERLVMLWKEGPTCLNSL